MATINKITIGGVTYNLSASGTVVIPAATASTLGGVKLEYNSSTNTLNIKTN